MQGVNNNISFTTAQKMGDLPKQLMLFVALFWYNAIF
jgi:hypothetical protein